MTEELKESGIVTAISVIGFVFGLIGMLWSLIPYIGAYAFVMGIPAAIVSGIALGIANSKKTKSTFAIVAITISCIGVFISVIQAYVVFPETVMGSRMMKIVDKYVGTDTHKSARPEIVIDQVILQDIRQRILTNYFVGSIRIVEGTAVNQADYPISRIAIKGEIIDAYTVMLGERTSYAGNVLSDKQLCELTEKEIQKILSHQEGNNNSNDKILPNGMIPFMIVFTREPAGVVKTTVRTVHAERFLQN